MNRRAFLLSLGMIACSSPATTKTTMRRRKPKPKPKPTRQATAPHGGNVDLLLVASQFGANKLAFHGDVLVHSVGEELRRWDATTMQRTDTWKLPHRHFCFVQDGTLVATGAKGTGTPLYRIAKGNVDTITGLILPVGGTHVLLPGRTPDQLYVTNDENIYVVRVNGRTADVERILTHPAPTSAHRDQWISRGDGRLIGHADGGGFAVVDLNSTRAYPTPRRVVEQLAGATRDRVWYAYVDLDKSSNKAQALILAPAQNPMAAEQTIDVAPSRIIHIASHGDAVAVLLVTPRPPDQLRWEVVVFEESGRERWRAEVPQALSTDLGLNLGFVAMSQSRVVVAKGDKLVAWDAETGKPVGEAS